MTKSKFYISSEVYANFIDHLNSTRHSTRHQRIGQVFFSYMKLEKLTSPGPRALADKIYNADDNTAFTLIRGLIHQ